MRWKVAAIRNEFKEKIESELATGSTIKPVVADTEVELEDVYAEKFDVRGLKFDVKIIDNSKINHELEVQTKDSRLIDSIKEGLHQSMQQHPNLILMGQDIAEYGGAFKITEGFVNEFGKERVRNTPLCESDRQWWRSFATTIGQSFLVGADSGTRRLRLNGNFSGYCRE